MALWRKNGGPPTELPAVDFDSTGSAWSDLINNEEGREACGWEEAGAPPQHDPETERTEWNEHSKAWAVVKKPTAKVSRLQLRLELFDRGLLDDVEGLVAAADGKVAIYWADTSEFHINHPVLRALISQRPDWTPEFIAEVFAAASRQT